MQQYFSGYSRTFLWSFDIFLHKVFFYILMVYFCPKLFFRTIVINGHILLIYGGPFFILKKKHYFQIFLQKEFYKFKIPALTNYSMMLIIIMNQFHHRRNFILKCPFSIYFSILYSAFYLLFQVAPFLFIESIQ